MRKCGLGTAKSSESDPLGGTLYSAKRLARQLLSQRAYSMGVLGLCLPLVGLGLDSDFFGGFPYW